MSPFVRSASLLIALLAAILLPASATAQEFNERQREELGKIIREYLLDNPEVLREAIQVLERKQKEAEETAAKAAIVEQAKEIYRSEADLVAGNPNGGVTMAEFFDYNCGYCKRAMPDVLKLIEADKDLRVVLKEWPILGEGSVYAAKAALASRKQGKYWDFHLALMQERSVNEPKVLEVAQRIGLDVAKLKADMQAPEVQEVIDRNMKLAEALGLRGTPAFLIGEQLLPGALPYRVLEQTIATVRKDGCKIC
jgi:protein-disulfide isomerase